MRGNHLSINAWCKRMMFIRFLNSVPHSMHFAAVQPKSVIAAFSRISISSAIIAMMHQNLRIKIYGRKEFLHRCMGSSTALRRVVAEAGSHCIMQFQSQKGYVGPRLKPQTDPAFQCSTSLPWKFYGDSVWLISVFHKRTFFFWIRISILLSNRLDCAQDNDFRWLDWLSTVSSRLTVDYAQGMNVEHWEHDVVFYFRNTMGSKR